MSEDTDVNRFLSDKTWVPLGKAVGVLVVVCGAGMWMQGMYAELRGLRREFTAFTEREERRTTEFRAMLNDHEGRIIRLESKP